MTVKRYDPIVNVSEPDVREHQNGDYVEYDDYATLQSSLDKAEAERDALREALAKAREALDGEPNYHHSGMGCGLEDRGIRDRYDAMHHGWECAMERVYGEHINPAAEIITEALSRAALNGEETNG